MLAVVDTGPLYASADEDDHDHARSISALRTPSVHLVIPTMVVAETSYLIGNWLGARAEASFLAGLNRLDVAAPLPEDWLRIAQLVEQYGDFPLGGTDASIVALAERLNTDLIITLDQRHFRAVRPRYCAAFRILPG